MGIQARLVSRLPRGVQHYPLDFAFVLLGVPSAALTMTGLSTSASLDAILPRWGQVVWSLILLVGGICWGIGVLSTSLDSDGHTVVIRRVPTMVFGLSLVSVAALVYAITIILYGGWSGLLASVPLFAVSFGTYIRRVRLITKPDDEGTDERQ